MIDRPPSRSYLRRHGLTVLPYVIAATMYIGLGVWDPRVLLSWGEGIPFVLGVVWGVPALWRWVRP